MSESNENDNSSSTMNSTETPKPHVENLVKDNIESPSSDKTKKKTMSIRRSVRGSLSQGTLKATVLTFQALKTNPGIARIQILLCNISERDIFAKLKCSTTSNVSALPSSSGHISPKSQLRILLTWKRPDNVTSWKDAGMPKILLTTYFLSHGQVSLDEEPTNTRLVAKINETKECNPDDPPIEQLLLDAVGKDTAVLPKTQSPPPQIIPREEESYHEEKDDSQWILLLLIVFVFILLLQQK